MAAKVRKQIYLESDQETTLKQLAKDTGMSEAEIIRQAINRYSLASHPAKRNLKIWEQEKAFIQQMIDQGTPQGDSTLKKRIWRREDLYDRKVLRGY